MSRSSSSSSSRSSSSGSSSSRSSFFVDTTSTQNPTRKLQRTSGRIKQFISAFGEHVIVSEIEDSLKEAIDQDSSIVRVREFSVAPQIEPELGLPYHEWFIEFETPPKNLEVFAKKIDDVMRAKNIYYNDLITGKILRPLILRKVVTEGFKKYMKSIGKLGGQNKVPRASDNRKIANVLKDYLIKD